MFKPSFKATELFPKRTYSVLCDFQEPQKEPFFVHNQIKIMFLDAWVKMQKLFKFRWRRVRPLKQVQPFQSNTHENECCYIRTSTEHLPKDRRGARAPRGLHKDGTNDVWWSGYEAYKLSVGCNTLYFISTLSWYSKRWYKKQELNIFQGCFSLY